MIPGCHDDDGGWMETAKLAGKPEAAFAPRQVQVTEGNRGWILGGDQKRLFRTFGLGHADAIPFDPSTQQPPESRLVVHD
jgi:hypothetical protein